MNILPSTIRRRPRNKKNLERRNNITFPVISQSRYPCIGETGQPYKANLENGFIICEDLEAASQLWNNGNFGRGSLSKHGLQNKMCSRDSEKFNEKSGTSNENAEDNLNIQEALYLGFEESLFLSYGLGILVVTDSKIKELNIDMMWSKFYQIDINFPPRYVVYHYFRSKGWIVKPGLQFGAEFMLYPGVASQYHAQFVAWIETVWEDTLETDDRFTSRMSGVQDITALERVSNQAGKNLLICQVLRPRSLTDEDLKFITCVKEFKINVTVLKRWIVGSDADGTEQTMVPV